MIRFGHRPLQHGFTLLEMVVVLVLVGILTGFALLSVGTDPMGEQVQNQGERLAALLRYHRDTAMLRIENRGLMLSEEGYTLLRWDGKQWLEVDDTRLAASGRLPAGLRLDLSVEDLPAVLKPEDDEKEADIPQVWLLSSGEMLPFLLVLSDASESYRFQIEGTAAGRIETVFESDG
jgi:general secretion pathway protein H